MSILDYVILFAYLVGILILGLAVSRKRPSRGEFLLAGRSMKWFVVGSSIMATVFSATNFTGFSGEVFGHGLYVLMAVPVFILVAFPVLHGIMPFYHRLKAVSAYEFLERNFDRRVRRLASALFILWRVAWMAVALYATGRLLSGVTGISLHSLIVLAGARLGCRRRCSSRSRACRRLKRRRFDADWTSLSWRRSIPTASIARCWP